MSLLLGALVWLVVAVVAAIGLGHLINLMGKDRR